MKNCLNPSCPCHKAEIKDCEHEFGIGGDRKGNHWESCIKCGKSKESTPEPLDWEKKYYKLCDIYEKMEGIPIEEIKSFISKVRAEGVEEGLQLRKHYTDFNEDELIKKTRESYSNGYKKGVSDTKAKINLID